MIPCDMCEGRGRTQGGARCSACNGTRQLCEKCDEPPGACRCDSPPEEEAPTERRIIVSNLPS